MAFQLFGPEMLAMAGGDVAKAGELAYPNLIAKVMPPFLRGVMLAALAGAVMSSFNSGLNSTSTIFTVDLYSKYIRRDASEGRQLRTGRIATAVIVVVACLWAPMVDTFEGVFKYIQDVWGFISPGIVAVFLIGLLVRRVPTVAAKTALLLGPVIYACCRVPKWIVEAKYDVDKSEMLVQDATGNPVGGFVQAGYEYFWNWSFLHHMGLVFVVLAAIMLFITWRRPRTEPITYPRSNIDTTVPSYSYILGSGVILATVALYAIFW